jgi:hypothetical protein
MQLETVMEGLDPSLQDPQQDWKDATYEDPGRAQLQGDPAHICEALLPLISAFENNEALPRQVIQYRALYGLRSEYDT